MRALARDRDSMAGRSPEEEEATSARGPRVYGVGDQIPNYDPASELFSLAICHSGFFVGEGKEKVYFDGTVHVFDSLDSDRFSIIEIEDMVYQLGYTVDERLAIWWLKPGGDLASGLLKLRKDKHVRAMMAYVPSNRLLWVYVEQIYEFDAVSSAPPDSSFFEDLSNPPAAPERNAECTPNSKAKRFSCRVENEPNQHQSPDNGNPGGMSCTDSDISYKPDGEVTDSEFHDSDYEIEDDDNLCSGFVNIEVEDGILKGQPTGDQGATKGKAKMDPDDSSEYGDSDNLQSLSGSSDDDELLSKKARYPSFNPAVDMQNPTFRVGMLFASMEEFREAVKEYSIRNRVNVAFRKNDKTRIQVKCKGRSACPFMIHARWLMCKQAVQVRGFTGEHTCVREDKIKWVSYKYLGKRFMDRFAADTNYSMASFAEAVRREMGLKVDRMKLYRARTYAKKLAQGVDKEQYAQLWDYAHELRARMPGSGVYVIPRDNLFDRMFVCFDPCKRGFLDGCRPIICLDGCHIKTAYGGQILAAVGIDPNDCIYPIAIAVVEVEDRRTWMWFLNTLKDELNIENTSAWTLMTDKQKGLIAAIEEQFPGAEHRFCVRHLYQNFQSNGFKGEGLKRMLWACARSTFREEFEHNMVNIRKHDQAAFEWLHVLDPRQWTRAHFRSFPKCDVLLNNTCEVFNKFILDARDKPILSMLETIRCQCMKRVFDKSREASRMKHKYKFCPKVLKKLNKCIELSSGCWATGSAVGEYQVMCQEGQYIVDLRSKTCTCNRWQLTGIPCMHSIPAISNENMSPEDMIHDCFRVEKLAAAYSYPIRSIRDPRQWNKSGTEPILPPLYQRKPGRPKKARRKSAMEMEQGAKLSRHGLQKCCTACGQFGHNRRSCTYGTQQPSNSCVEQQPETAPSTQHTAPSTQDTAPSRQPEIARSTQHTAPSRLPDPAPSMTSDQFANSSFNQGSATQQCSQRSAPASCVFLEQNALPPPTVRMTTASRKGKAVVNRKRNRKGEAVANM